MGDWDRREEGPVPGQEARGQIWLLLSERWVYEAILWGRQFPGTHLQGNPTWDCEQPCSSWCL